MMGRRKSFVAGVCIALVVLACVILLWARQPDFTSIVNRQTRFLEQQGYLLGQEDAFDDYYAAIGILRAHGATVEQVKNMTADDVFFKETRDALMESLRNAASQKACRMPSPRYLDEVIQYKGKTVEVREVESLLPHYVVRSLELEAGEHSPELGYLCLAMGVQLSKYRNHDVIWVTGIAMKTKALDRLVRYYEHAGDEENLAEAGDLRAEVQVEYEQYKDAIKKRRVWPWR